MLQLTRKIGESILIDGGIKVVVLDVRGSTVRLGIAAPHETKIMRSELVAEQPEQGRRHDAERMDCEGQDAPLFDHDPLLIGGEFGP